MKINETRIIVGLGYGDEGKGTMTDFLCREHGATLVVRYNGGAQAAHNVVTDDGKHHTFAQIGSGAFVPGVKTLLSKFMLFDPIALAHEVAEFNPKIGENILDRHFIDCRAPIITPFHVAANRLKEWIRDKGRHGSCGKGIGETAYDLVYHPDEIIRAGMLKDPVATERIMRKIQLRKLQAIEEMNPDWNGAPDSIVEMLWILRYVSEAKKVAGAYEMMANTYNIVSHQETARMVKAEKSVFEGAQGVLLDEWHGFHPYTTWSTITTRNANEILGEAGFAGTRETIGVMRTYATRHGAGPFVTELGDMQDIFSGEHNNLNDWQGKFKVGAFDGVQFRYALECLAETGGINAIALTHLDAFDRRKEIPYADAYAARGQEVTRLTPAFTQDLVHQEGLTNLLLDAHPIVRDSFKGQDEIVHYIEKTAGVRVKYTSNGWQAKHKKVL